MLDPVLVDFVRDSLRKAERGGAEALVVQLNSARSVVSRLDADVLTFRVAHARAPVAVWVGPSGARAEGAAARLVRAAAVSGAAPGTRIRPRTPVDLAAPTLGDFVVGLDGRRAGGRRLETADVVRTGRGLRRRPNVAVSFAKPALVPRLLHTVASPAVAFLLLLAGLLLVAFEFFTAGVGLAGAVGAGCLVLAGYGLGVLPTRPVGLVLVGVGILGYAVDLQAGAPRAWAVIGSAALVLGALNFYRGLSPGLLPMTVGVVGAALFMVPGMATMVRTRFSTPTIGREAMVGELGTAAVPLDPEGTVRVRGALWRGRTSRATPVAAGAPVRVVAVDGLVLRVEPDGRPGARES